MTVLLIALLHGLPIFVLGATLDSKHAANAATVVMIIVAVVTGSENYLIYDLLAIVVARLWLNSYMRW